MKRKLYEMLKLFPLFAFGASVLLFIAMLLLRNVPTNLSYTYENGEILYHSWRYSCRPLFLPGFIVLAVLLLASAVAYIVAGIKHWESRSRAGIAAIGALVTVVPCAFLWILSYMGVVGNTIDEYEPDYYEFSNQAHTIVIEESSWLLGGFGKVFQIKDNQEAVLILKFLTDDGFRNGGNYQLEWYDDHVDITGDRGDLHHHLFTDSAFFED